MPGAGQLTAEELQSISQTSCEVISQLGKSYYWIQSFITGDKIYCIHIAENEQAVGEHAMPGRFPVNTIPEVKAIIDQLTANNR